MSTPRYGPVERVAVLADVHGNVPALQAVLADVARAKVDLIVFPGDVTWGSEPQLTVELIQDLGDRAICVRGNADRAVIELARGERPHELPRDPWMPGQHSPAALEFVAGFPFSVVVDIMGLGPVWFGHGSPRGDTELITPATPAERFEELAAGLEERILVSAHTHLQFDRAVAGRRSINAGSVGLPYHTGDPGTAYWAVLGPDVQLRATRYDVEESIRRARHSGDPSAEAIVGLLLNPPTPEDVIAHAEPLVFSD